MRSAFFVFLGVIIGNILYGYFTVPKKKWYHINCDTALYSPYWVSEKEFLKKGGANCKRETDGHGASVFIETRPHLLKQLDEHNNE